MRTSSAFSRALQEGDDDHLNVSDILICSPGVGGFRAGLGPASGGFQCVGHCEIDKYAEASYRAIHDIRKGGSRYYPDARAIDPNDLPDFDLLCGGFPCQAFSTRWPQKRI